MLSEKINKIIDTFLKMFSVEIYKLTALIFAFLFKLKIVLQIMFVLIIIDLLTGIIASIKRKDMIKSNRLIDTLIKVYVYYTVVFTMILVEISLATDYFTKLVCWFAILTEAKSIIENLSVFMPEILKIKEKLANENNKKTDNTLQ